MILIRGEKNTKTKNKKKSNELKWKILKVESGREIEDASCRIFYILNLR